MSAAGEEKDPKEDVKDEAPAKVAAKKPAAKKAAAEKPAAEESTAEKETGGEAKKPAAKKTTAKEPVAEEAAAKEPVAKGPAEKKLRQPKKGWPQKSLSLPRGPHSLRRNPRAAPGKAPSSNRAAVSFAPTPAMCAPRRARRAWYVGIYGESQCRRHALSSLSPLVMWRATGASCSSPRWPMRRTTTSCSRTI